MSEDQEKSDGRTEIIPPIPDTPENVAKAIMMNKPKKEWDYLKRNQARKFGVGRKEK
ncbi:MAG: hypothetical protein OXH71_05220 [Candidatus Dadabacteria bacterium]|nr:hypothetical protein [Candidatus Dadabacteria bacterium]MDE0520076.1 hypothetical protein [Candidatus Dadabacteria bacterium]MDE0663392.1 hypothetical protein [Candidatus Dadabacteria bacterium]